MWKLTVTRIYEREYSTFDGEDEVYFEAKFLDELAIIIEKFAKFGTDGTYEYKITKGEGEADA